MRWQNRPLLAITCAVFFGTVVSLERPSDPLCDGRVASAWARDLLSADRSARERAEEAFRKLGPDGVAQLRVLIRSRSWPWQENSAITSLLPFLRRKGADPAVCRERGAEVIALLGENGVGAAPDLVAALAEPAGASAAERALSRIGSGAFEDLLRGLNSRKAEARLRCARLLRSYVSNRDECVPPLLLALGDDDFRVRLEAAKTLGDVGRSKPGVIARLIETSRDKTAEVRAASLNALGKLRDQDPKVLETLNVALNDIIPLVRLEAAKAHWLLTGDPTIAVRALIGVLPTQEGWQAAYALGEIGPGAAEAVPALIQALKREKVPRAFRTPPSSCFALGKIGQPAVAALEKVLENGHEEVRIAAVLAFGFMGESARSAIPKLQALLHDPDPEIRHVTAITLAGAGASREMVLASLADCLTAEDIYMRSTAAALLRQIAPEREWTGAAE